MQITRVKIKHFRSIKKIDIPLRPTSVLAGPNSCGKSNVLRAIRFAFLNTYAPERASPNFPVFVTGPAAEISVSLEFGAPSASLAAHLGISPGSPFAYEVAVRRSGKPRFTLNGAALSPSLRDFLVGEFSIVYIPPIRDIASGGLDPLMGLLSRALRNARRGQSISALNTNVREALARKGGEVVQRAGQGFGSIADVGSIAIDVSSVDISTALEQLSLRVDLAGGSSVPLASLGTGHQSQVVMNLFGAVGATLPGQVIYMFEEPDNHLHPTALLAVAKRMREATSAGNIQIFASSHSAPFIGSFPIGDVTALECEAGVTGIRKRDPALSQRRLHSLMATYGMKPIEALLARAVLLVEGPSDVSLIRGFCRHAFGAIPDQKDVLIVPCGGKKQVAELYAELIKLGVPAYVVLDGDAAFRGAKPYLTGGLSATQVASVTSAIAMLSALTHTEAEKVRGVLQGLNDEAVNGYVRQTVFSGTPVEKIAKATGKLNAVALAQVSAAFSAGRRRVWKRHLVPAGVWVWKSDPETVLASIAGASSIIRAALAALGRSGGPPLSAGHAEINGWIHNQASEPELHEEVCSRLLASLVARTGELWEFVAFLRTILR